MKITSKEFSELKTENEVDALFGKAGFSNVYKIAKNNLKIFSEKKHLSYLFENNLNKIISNNTKVYSKKLGYFYKIGSKIHNLFVLHRFKSTLELANELKNSISKQILQSKDAEKQPDHKKIDSPLPSQKADEIKSEVKPLSSTLQNFSNFEGVTAA